MQGGLYILTLMDTFIGGEMLPWIGLAEIVVVVFGYGRFQVFSLLPVISLQRRDR